MDELEKKLRQVKVKVYHAGQGTFDYPLTDENIQEIKQAFQAAAWREPEFVGPDSITSMGIDQTETEIEYDNPPVERFGPPLMTGPEFLERFERELEGLIQSSGLSGTGKELLESLALMGIVKEAARRAAGVEG